MHRTIERLLVVSHVVHYQCDGRLFAYGPYSREIDVWAELFPRVLIAAPRRFGLPPGDCLPFECPNIELIPQAETGGRSVTAKLKQILRLPSLVWQLSKAMRRADAIHVRCPGNLGLLGLLLAPLFSRYLVAKYAGQWKAFHGEGAPAKFQRALLRSFWWRGPVTVYGNWPRQPRNVVPFFTSVLTERQIGRARSAAGARRPSEPFRVLFVGRLSRDKNVHVLLEAVARVALAAGRIECVVAGEGPERRALETQAVRLAIADRVRFAGGLAFEEVLGEYERAHVLVLASNSEGWPKAITEAMAFGVLCIGSDCGLVPQILGEGRGLVVPPGDASALADALNCASNPVVRAGAGRRAAAWAQRYSLEGLREALRELLRERWGVALADAGGTGAPVRLHE